MVTESIGQILLRETNLTSEQLDQALRIQQTKRPRAPIGEILIREKLITPEQLTRALALQWSVPYLVEIKPDQVNAKEAGKLPLPFLKQHQLLPIITSQGRTAIAMTDPLDIYAYDAVLNLLEKFYPRVLSTGNEIEKAISRCFYHDVATDSSEPSTNNKRSSSSPLTGGDNREDLLNIANQAPIVKLVNTILFQATNYRASDIHFEPYEDQFKVRLRIDGVLHDYFQPPRHQAAALISRLKIMANLNIAERRLPQDGHSRIKIGEKQFDVRVSTIPTSGGERIVLRLLDRTGPGLSLEKLGFSRETQQHFSQLICNPYGILLLTGPTGSGKTTTLYCAINELNNQERNILTVEDPIEYQLPGVGQMQVKPKIGLTFANSLRHILRQDPDVIMIGEIRDVETAEIAIHASLTGHMVLSTLHTNDSASAITRLLDMGIEPYLISSSLLAVMAQRLLRKICPHCKSACKIEPNLLNILNADKSNLLGTDQFYTGLGCENCMQTGYYERAGISELLIIDEKIKEHIINRSAAHLIKEYAVNNGMLNLRDDGIRQSLAGNTTLEEVLRVTQDNWATEKNDIAHV